MEKLLSFEKKIIFFIQIFNFFKKTEKVFKKKN